jgi:hypothetical protein
MQMNDEIWEDFVVEESKLIAQEDLGIQIFISTIC